MKQLETGLIGSYMARIDLKALENGLAGRDRLDFGTVRHFRARRWQMTAKMTAKLVDGCGQQQTIVD